MASKKQIVFSNTSQKQELIELVKEGKIVPAIKKVQDMTGADKRIAREYIERLRAE